MYNQKTWESTTLKVPHVLTAYFCNNSILGFISAKNVRRLVKYSCQTIPSIYLGTDDISRVFSFGPARNEDTATLSPATRGSSDIGICSDGSRTGIGGDSNCSLGSLCEKSVVMLSATQRIASEIHQYWLSYDYNGYWIWSYFSYREQSLRMRSVTWPIIGGKNGPHFWNHDPNLPIHFVTFRGYDED